MSSPLWQRLYITPLELAEANALVGAHHRHHKPAVGHRFSLGVMTDTGLVVGAAVCGRPVARLISDRDALEVVRCVTDGTPNACSALYGAAARVAKAQGYLKIQTYVLEEETAVSLRAAGWVYDGASPGGQWVHTDGRPRRTDQPNTPKGRWAVHFRPRPAFTRLNVPVGAEAAAGFDLDWTGTA